MCSGLIGLQGLPAILQHLPAPPWRRRGQVAANRAQCRPRHKTPGSAVCIQESVWMKPRSGLTLVFSRPTFFRARFAAHSNQIFFRFDLLLLAVNADGTAMPVFRLVDLLNLRASMEVDSTLAVDAGPILWKFLRLPREQAAATSRQS